MNLEGSKLVYLASTAEIQARILVRHAHTLTVAARDTYKVGTEEVLDSASLREVNERMHRLTSQISLDVFSHVLPDRNNRQRILQKDGHRAMSF